MINRLIYLGYRPIKLKKRVLVNTSEFEEGKLVEETF